MRKEFLAITAILAALVSDPDTAEAHGRLPEVTRISSGPGGTMLARASFGLLLSKDAGSRWDLVCGKAAGFDVIEDPVYAVAPDGAMLATTAKGLSISRDGACSWSTSSAGSGMPFVDVMSDGRTALSSRYEASDGTSFRYDTRLWRGEVSPGSALDPSVVPNSFVVSGSRIDVAAVRYDADGKRGAVLVTSPDGGATWAESPVTLLPGEERIGAVAGDAGRVWLRTFSKGASRLLVHDAAGARTVYEAPNGIRGIAFSQDLSDVWVAAGVDGIVHAKANDAVFTKVSSLDAGCLAFDGQGLWACAEQWKAGFVIGLSRDGGATFEPRLQLCGIRGDLECAEGCAGEWEREKKELGCEQQVAPAGEKAETEPAEQDVSVREAAASSASCAMHARRSTGPIGVTFLLALLARFRRVQSRHGGREHRDARARRPRRVR